MKLVTYVLQKIFAASTEFLKLYQSLTGLLKTVTTEQQKNQEVVDKIDEV